MSIKWSVLQRRRVSQGRRRGEEWDSRNDIVPRSRLDTDDGVRTPSFALAPLGLPLHRVVHSPPTVQVLGVSVPAHAGLDGFVASVDRVPLRRSEETVREDANLVRLLYVVVATSLYWDEDPPPGSLYERRIEDIDG